LITVVIATLLLAGCATPSVEELVEEAESAAEEVEEAVEEAPAEEEMAEEEAPAEEEMAEEEEMVEPAGEADLDAAYSAALDGMTGYWVITVDALTEQLAESDVFLVDVRETAELEETGHIEGAVHIPLRELAQHTDLLPGFDTPLVVYCKSGFRGALATASLNAMGWDARNLAGGITGWLDAGNPTVEGVPAAEPLEAAEVDPALLAAIDANHSTLPEGWGVVTVEALAEELAEEAPVLIDVRRPDEVLETGMIEGATHVQLETLVADHSLWPESKDANIVVYCKSGTRGAYAMSILRTYGYTNVRNLAGGIVGWIGAGNPVAGGLDGNYGAFLSGMEGYQQISPEALSELLAEAPDTFMIDVRNVAELEEVGYIEGAINIPLTELAQHTDLLPSLDTPLVVYCKAGTRGIIGMMSLVGMGYTDVRNLSGGFDAWAAAGNATVEGVPEAEALNAVEFDPAVLAVVDTHVTTYEGWGQVTNEALVEELAEDPEALVLVDVRRPEEVEEVGVIEGAVSIPLEEMVGLKGEWPAKDANIVVYCKAGTRGNMAMAILRMYGYTNVRNLAGGITGWTDAGNPVVPAE
jgi:rhodanese-related sulfurtransferase